MSHRLAIPVLVLAAVLAGCGGQSADSGTAADPSPAPSDATAAAGDAYPLTTCVVSGEPLDAMGGPHVVEHEGRTVKLCCKDCVKDFQADPQAFLAQIDAAAAGEAPAAQDQTSHDDHDHAGHGH